MTFGAGSGDHIVLRSVKRLQRRRKMALGMGGHILIEITARNRPKFFPKARSTRAAL